MWKNIRFHNHLLQRKTVVVPLTISVHEHNSHSVPSTVPLKGWSTTAIRWPNKKTTKVEKQPKSNNLRTNTECAICSSCYPLLNCFSWIKRSKVAPLDGGDVATSYENRDQSTNISSSPRSNLRCTQECKEQDIAANACLSRDSLNLPSKLSAGIECDIDGRKLNSHQRKPLRFVSHQKGIAYVIDLKAYMVRKYVPKPIKLPKRLRRLRDFRSGYIDELGRPKLLFRVDVPSSLQLEPEELKKLEETKVTELRKKLNQKMTCAETKRKLILDDMTERLKKESEYLDKVWARRNEHDAEIERKINATQTKAEENRKEIAAEMQKRWERNKEKIDIVRKQKEENVIFDCERKRKASNTHQKLVDANKKQLDDGRKQKMIETEVRRKQALDNKETLAAEKIRKTQFQSNLKQGKADILRWSRLNSTRINAELTGGKKRKAVEDKEISSETNPSPGTEANIDKVDLSYRQGRQNRRNFSNGNTTIKNENETGVDFRDEDGFFD